jgi:hypothetical protein
VASSRSVIREPSIGEIMEMVSDMDYVKSNQIISK